MRFSVYQESHIGGRKSNQDRMGYCFTRDALLLILADGMGGHVKGEIAATLALQTMGAFFQKTATPEIKKPEQFFEESFLAAHQEIHRYQLFHQLPDSPRTTIVACLIQRNTIYWAHCGDSRLYWMRNGQLVRRTKDHSRVEVLMAQGLIDESQLQSHPERNKLVNCLGAPVLPMVDIASGTNLLPGDVILLCSDGLWAVLQEEEIRDQFHTNTIVRAVPNLLSKALVIAGKTADNATALAMVWGGGDDDPSAVTTATLPADVVTTSIQASFSSSDSTTPLGSEEGGHLVDDDIEQAIEEIRMAIQKAST